jgi:hypothetical protein
MESFGIRFNLLSMLRKRGAHPLGKDGLPF